MSTTQRVKDKVAIVTGSGGAIGRTIAKVLAANGAKVAIVDLSESEGQQTLNEIEEQQPGSAIFKKVDVSKEEEVISLVKSVVEKWGRVDVLVNNAAAFVFGTVEEATSDDWDRVLSINVKGYALMAKHVVSQMKLQNASHPSSSSSSSSPSTSSIINIGSISSFVAQPAFTPYNTSKGAILQLTRCIAMDYGPSWIRCNCICPGFIDTPATDHHASKMGIPKSELIGSALKDHFLKRVGNTRDVADAVLFLASDESTFITGQTLCIDGGYLAH